VNEAAKEKTPDAKFVAGHFGDRAFKWLTLLMALTIFILVALIGFELVRGAMPSIQKSGWHFLVSSDWDPVNDVYGALPFIFGTLVSALIALIIAVPISIATAVYLTELAPARIRQPLIMFIELLAAVPSVILGLWGIFVMVPFLRDHFFPLLKWFFNLKPFVWNDWHLFGINLEFSKISPNQFFSGPIYGVSMMAGGIIVAIMIIPIITSVSREILRSVPGLQREAAYALGATRWEVTRIAVLSYAKKGLFGAVILGLGRALGETMAVTMVIGNTPQIVKSLFAPGYTLASVIANEFNEATGNLYPSALFEIGLVLLGVTVVVNTFAQLLLKTFAGPSVKPQH
jgi:phosphate transport system permease protein